MARRLSLAVGLLAIALALVVVLLQRDERRSGSDLTPNGAFVFPLHPSQEACQGGELAPADTAALRMTLGSYDAPGPALSVRLTDARGQTVTSGGLAAGWKQGIVRIPVHPVRRASDQNRICIRDEGPGSFAVAGTKPDPGFTMTVAGRTVADLRFRVDYLRPGRETWASMAPVIVHRFSLGKADWLRHWAWVAYLVLLLGAIAVAAALLLRPEAER